MVVLTRIGDEVYYGDKKLTIIKQETKGPGKEVVKIEGLEGTNGQKWIALKKLVEGENQIECEAKPHSGGYSYTPEEEARMKELQAEMDAIKAAAKARYVPKSAIRVEKMSQAELEKYIETLQMRLKSLDI